MFNSHIILAKLKGFELDDSNFYYSVKELREFISREDNATIIVFDYFNFTYGFGFDYFLKSGIEGNGESYFKGSLLFDEE